MKIVRPVLLALVLAAALWPEIPRYRAERGLRAATGALRIVITHAAELPDPPGALERIALIARDAAPALPGDPRPPILEGSAWFVRGDAERAAVVYRSALALGERPETDLNLARAYERLGRESDARAAYVRAAWISPALSSSMLPDAAAEASAEIARLDAELKAGRLTTPPPPPR